MQAPFQQTQMARCPGPEFTPLSANEDLAGVQGKPTSIKFKAVKPLLC